MTASHANVVETFRLAQHDDLPAILSISNWAAMHTPANFAIEPESLESWHQSWRETHEQFPWVVAEDGRQDIVGFAKASPWKGRCAYHWTAETTVYVHHEHFGKRIGTALYTHLIQALKAQGYRTLLGGITLPNDASVRLHESLGYRKVAQLERVGWKLGRWHDVGYWELVLDASDRPPVGIRRVDEIAND